MSEFGWEDEITLVQPYETIAQAHSQWQDRLTREKLGLLNASDEKETKQIHETR